MSVTVKAFLHRRWNEDPVEIRRFTIDQDVTTSYAYLVEKIAQVFPSLRAEGVIVTWVDNDGDHIVISSDEELLEAVDQFDGSVFRLYLKKRDAPKSEGPEDQEGEAPSEEEPSQCQRGVFHPNIMCDECRGPVYGNRYKCLVCHNYDLCSACEAKGLHSEHNMVTIETPWSYSPWGFHHHHPWTRYPHFRGRHGGHPRPGGQGCPYRWGRGGCFFPQQTWTPQPCGGARGRWHTHPCGGQAWGHVPGKQEPMETDQTGEKDKCEDEQSQEQRCSILRDIGEAVTSFLEPFGVKVNLDMLGAQDQGNQEDQHPSAPPTVPSGATLDTEYVPPSQTSSQGEEVPSATPGETLPGASPTSLEQVVAQLQNMGFDDEGGWLTELVKAKGGDIGKVLDALNPTATETD